MLTTGTGKEWNREGARRELKMINRFENGCLDIPAPNFSLLTTLETVVEVPFEAVL